MTMITPSYLGETIEYSSLHACRSTLEDPTGCTTESCWMRKQNSATNSRSIHDTNRPCLASPTFNSPKGCPWMLLLQSEKFGTTLPNF